MRGWGAPSRSRDDHHQSGTRLVELGHIERCKTWGLTRRVDNPCTEVKRFRESRGRERILTYLEEDALLAALPEPHRTVTQLALECGARLQSELLPITWADVDLDKARLTITATHAKNGRARHLPLSPGVVERLRAPPLQGRLLQDGGRGGAWGDQAGHSQPAPHLGLAHG
jgi:integrase